MSHAATLHSLLRREWQYQLEQCPTYASILGDRRHDDRWDDRSLDAIDADHRHNLAVLEQLGQIDRAGLSAEEQLNYDLFRHDYASWVEEYEHQGHLWPTNQLGGVPEGVRQPPGVQAAYQIADKLRFETVGDYEGWVTRLERFGAYVDQVIALMREGARGGRLHPKVVLSRIPAQVERQLVDDPEASGFYAPFRRFAASIAGAERGRLAAAARAAVAGGVLPALRRFHRFLVDEHLPAAPDEVGAWQYPGGEAAYAFLARRFTTTALTPDEIHEIGLAEVARIRAEMEATKARAGFSGPLEAFFHALRTEPRFFFRSGDELLLHARALAKRIDPLLVKLFKTLPRQPYGVEPVPDELAPDFPTAFYFPGAADGSRAGSFLVNLYQPETRPRVEMVPLTLHEAVPGHHLQTQLAAEQDGLTEFRRYGFHVAYGEGWALYAETLGDELGLYDDPYDKFGQLSLDMWRAVRLVVDTGLHARKWGRQRAIDYFMANSPRSELDVVNEIDRYVALPGQALGYKIGQLKIRELRTRAERALGGRFDVRAFHDLVLLSGSVTLDILEARVTAWVAAQSASLRDASGGEGGAGPARPLAGRALRRGRQGEHLAGPRVLSKY
jgi:uncharacterized protein (DUF885 family)